MASLAISVDTKKDEDNKDGIAEERYATCLDLPWNTIISFPAGYRSPLLATLAKFPPDTRLESAFGWTSAKYVWASAKVQYGDVILTAVGRLNNRMGRRGCPKMWNLTEALIIEVDERHTLSPIRECDLYQPVSTDTLMQYRVSMQIQKSIQYTIEPCVPPPEIVVYHPPIPAESLFETDTWRHRPNTLVSTSYYVHLVCQKGSNDKKLSNDKKVSNEKKSYAIRQYADGGGYQSSSCHVFLVAECASAEQANTFIKLNPL